MFAVNLTQNKRLFPSSELCLPVAWFLPLLSLDLALGSRAAAGKL